MKLRILTILLIVFCVSQFGYCETLDTVSTTTTNNSEITAGIIKFATVMAGVMFSSVAIYFGLSIWNAILSKSRSKKVNYEMTLKSPQSVQEAILLFIHKNKLK